MAHGCLDCQGGATSHREEAGGDGYGACGGTLRRAKVRGDGADTCGRAPWLV